MRWKEYLCEEEFGRTQGGSLTGCEERMKCKSWIGNISVHRVLAIAFIN